MPCLCTLVAVHGGSVRGARHGLCDSDSNCRRIPGMAVANSQHYCCKCHRYFSVDTSDLASPKSHYTNRALALAVRLGVEDGLPYRAASWHLWRDHRVFVPYATIQNWVEAGGKSTGARRRELSR